MSQVLCPVLAVDHNSIITQSNINSILPSTFERTPGTKVSLSCYVPATYSLQGPSQLVCDKNGQWTPGVPKCVKTSSVNTGDGTTVEDKEVPTTKSDSDPLSNYGIILIAVAVACVLILIVFLLIFLCKYSWRRKKADDGMEEPITTTYESPPRAKMAKVEYGLNNPISTYSMEYPTRAKVEYGLNRPLSTYSTEYPSRAKVPQRERVKMNTFSSSASHEIYTGPSSTPSWHNHPIILMADRFSYSSWSQLSSDQFLRDLETSRRHNPNHSWRDFATLSSHSSRSFSII